MALVVVEVAGFCSAAAAAAIPFGSSAFKVGVSGFVWAVLNDAFMEDVLKLNALGLAPAVLGVDVKGLFCEAVIEVDPNCIGADGPEPPKDKFDGTGGWNPAAGLTEVIGGGVPKDLLADPPNMEVPVRPNGVDAVPVVSGGALNAKPVLGGWGFGEGTAMLGSLGWATDCVAVVGVGLAAGASDDVAMPKDLSEYLRIN